MKNAVLFGLLVGSCLLLGEAAAQEPNRDAVLQFTLPEPREGEGDAAELRATHYVIWSVDRDSSASGVPLIDTSGRSIPGSELSARNWCQAANNGSVRISSGGSSRVYNFIRVGPREVVNCEPYFRSFIARDPDKNLPIVRGFGRSVWRAFGAEAPFGCGQNARILVPYRTIAAPPEMRGFSVYIPQARGRRVPTPTGGEVVHDGWFLAGDSGGDINNSRIDIFAGERWTGAFGFVDRKNASNQLVPVSARVFPSAHAVSRALEAVHPRHCR